MVVQTIHKNLQQQKQANILFADIQYQLQIEKKRTLYRGEDCMKKFSTSL